LPELIRLAPYLALIGAAGLIVGIVGLILAWTSLVAARRLRKRMDQLLRGGQATDLETLLHEQWQALREAQSGVQVAAARLDSVEARLRRSLQRVGVVRYNAFPGAGAELSFSVALLDAEDDGVVVTGLYGREETRIYAKPVVSGTSRYPLSEEERVAIEAAIESKHEVHAV
jgi:hypothetical protein